MKKEVWFSQTFEVFCRLAKVVPGWPTNTSLSHMQAIQGLITNGLKSFIGYETYWQSVLACHVLPPERGRVLTVKHSRRHILSSKANCHWQFKLSFVSVSGKKQVAGLKWSTKTIRSFLWRCIVRTSDCPAFKYCPTFFKVLLPLRV